MTQHETSSEDANSTSIAGELEVDAARGVVYFHGITGQTHLRICGLPPDGLSTGVFIDVTHLRGSSYIPLINPLEPSAVSLSDHEKKDG